MCSREEILKYREDKERKEENKKEKERKNKLILLAFVVTLLTHCQE